MLSAEPGDQTEAVRVAELQLLAFDMGMRLILNGAACLNSVPTPGSGVTHAFLAYGLV